MVSSLYSSGNSRVRALLIRYEVKAAQALIMKVASVIHVSCAFVEEGMPDAPLVRGKSIDGIESVLQGWMNTSRRFQALESIS
jgi:hypothetical protein